MMQRNQHKRDGDENSEVAALLQEKDPNADEEPLTEDDVFEVLYNRRRRDIITHLQDNDGESTVSDLAEHIAAKENDTTVQMVGSSERKSVYVGLYQNHLPMMDDLGVVDYNKNRGTVHIAEPAAQLMPYLDDPVDSGIDHVNVGAAVALAGLLLLGVLEVSAFSLVSDWLLVVVGVSGLVLMSLYDQAESVLDGKRD